MMVLENVGERQGGREVEEGVQVRADEGSLGQGSRWKS